MTLGRGLALADQHGRVATDLRVSLTDRCNLRCSYCMPAEGLDWLPKPTLLTDDEVVRLVGIAVGRLGIRDVRFTGGEPLLRRGLVDIVRAVAQLTPRPSMMLTTNGIGLTRLAAPLAEAGLDRVNVSLDSLDPARFASLTRRDRHADVLAGLAAAADAGLVPVKMNAVLMRGLNDDEAVPLLSFALAHGYELRFIEQMPLDAGHTWRREEMVTGAAILAQLRSAFDLQPDPAERGGAPAETWLVPGHDAADGRPAKVGVIASRVPPVLRRLRPDPADRRRRGPLLPVQRRGDRPAQRSASRRQRRRPGRALAQGDVGQAGRPRHRRPHVPAAGPPDVARSGAEPCSWCATSRVPGRPPVRRRRRSTPGRWASSWRPSAPSVPGWPR